jgi:hypothetical protein
MRKIVLMILLALASSSALAEWVRIGTAGPGGQIILYVDPASVLRDGDRVRMWDLADRPATGTDQPINRPLYMSVKTLREYDCKLGRIRTLSLSRQSENMGEGLKVQGAAVDSDPVLGKWGPIPPKSALADMWKIACKKLSKRE